MANLMIASLYSRIRRKLAHSAPIRVFFRLYGWYSRWSTRFENAFGMAGWRMGVFTAAVGAAIVLVINLVGLVWVYHSYNVQGGVGTIFEGACTKADTLNLWLHLALNVLSMLLLAGGNYAQQCLTSPTRDDVDKVHMQGRWLDIGIPSWTNVCYNAVIFETSPANEYYAVITTGDILDHGFVRNLQPGISPNTRIHADDEFIQELVDNSSNWTWYDPKDCIRLYNTDYLKDYRNIVLFTEKNDSRINPYISILEISQRDMNDPAHSSGHRTPLQDWLCNLPTNDSTITTNQTYLVSPHAAFDSCSVDTILDTINVDQHWTIFKNFTKELLNKSIPIEDITDEHYGENIPLAGCRAEKSILTECKVQVSVVFLGIVIICNLVKGCSLVAILWRRREFEPLVTIGDALDSYVRKPDHTTEGLCVASRVRFHAAWCEKKDNDQKKSYWGNSHTFSFFRRLTQYLPSIPEAATRALKPQYSYLRAVGRRDRKFMITNAMNRWCRSASVIRWSVCLVFNLTGIVFAIYLLHEGLLTYEQGWRSINLLTMWKDGFGTADGVSLLFGGRDLGLHGATLLANAPQLALSILYFMYNGIFTCMLTGKEWTSYARHRKPLRTSNPRGEQRSTYYLQLPYSYAVPLMVVSSLLQWLLSQAIFLVYVEVRGSGDNFTDYSKAFTEAAPIVASFSTVGYSCIALILLLLVSVLSLAYLALNACRRYKTIMPLAPSSSGAIAAACHPLKGTEYPPDASEKPLKWGDMGRREDGFRHAGFSDKKVRPCRVDELYY